MVGFLDMLNKGSLKVSDLAEFNFVEETTVDGGALVLNGQWAYWPCFSSSGGGIRIGTELGEGSDLTVCASLSFIGPANSWTWF